MTPSNGEVAAWVLRSYPEQGDAAFLVKHTSPLTGGMAAEVLEGLRGYFASRPFVRALQRAIAERRDEVAVSIESQEMGASLWRDHAPAFLRDMYRAHADGKLPFGEHPAAVEGWVSSSENRHRGASK